MLLAVFVLHSITLESFNVIQLPTDMFYLLTLFFLIFYSKNTLTLEIIRWQNKKDQLKYCLQQQQQ
jgi:cytochrome c biogenesis factor